MRQVLSPFRQKILVSMLEDDRLNYGSSNNLALLYLLIIERAEKEIACEHETLLMLTLQVDAAYMRAIEHACGTYSRSS